MKTGISRPRTIIIATLLAVALVAAGCLGGCSWFGSSKEPAKKSVVKAEPPKPKTCPLCGLVPADPVFLQRRPVGVKIENDPAARPQSGLDQACVVYEEECEGGVTRFLAVYLDRNVEVVGPVRSARPADIDISFPYNLLFCHCGGAPPIIAMVKASGIADLDEMAWPGAYWRSGDRRAPHNLYSSTMRLRQAGDTAYPYQGEAAPSFKFLTDKEQAKMEEDRSKQVKRDLANQAHPDPSYVPAFTVITNIHIPYDPICVVDYRYDSSTGRFLRFVRGAPHTDLATGQQLNADTVIVQYVTTTPSGLVDVLGADTPNLGIVGAGRAQVFVRGRIIEANWSKPTRTAHTLFTDNAGKVIPVKPGTTWVELVPTDMQITFN
ncbi:MAG: DUF3048 domain-containing protein [Candidatus Geothermincolia bacterium]